MRMPLTTNEKYRMHIWLNVITIHAFFLDKNIFPFQLVNYVRHGPSCISQRVIFIKLRDFQAHWYLNINALQHHLTKNHKLGLNLL